MVKRRQNMSQKAIDLKATRAVNAPKAPKGITRGGKHRFDIECAGISGSFYVDPKVVKGVDKANAGKLVLTLE